MMPSQPDIASKSLFRRYENLDELYFLSFYICVGFLPAFITLVGDKALQVPFLVISVLTGVRICLRKPYQKRFFLEIRKPYFLLLVAFSLLLAVYGVWGISQDFEQLRIIKKSLIVILFLMVAGYIQSNPEDINALRLIHYMMAGILLALLFVAGETLLGYYFVDGKLLAIHKAFSFLNINKLNRGLEVISVLIFIAMSGFHHGRGNIYLTALLVIFMWILSFLVLGAIPREIGWRYAYHVDSETVQFGLPAALLIFITAYRLPRLMTDLVFASICLVLLLAPWLFLAWYEVARGLSIPKIYKILVRSEIWDGVSRAILEAPFLGYGIDSVRYLQQVNIAHIYFKPLLIWHPHNMFLQVWLDIGFAGVLIVLGLIILGWRAVRRLDLAKRPAVLASTVMLSLFGLVTHSLWQTWSMALMATMVITVLVIINTWPEKTKPDHT